MSPRHTFLMALSLALPAAAAAQTPAQPGALSRYELPATVSFPEGVAHDARSNKLYTAGAADGTVARIDIATRAVEIVAPAGTLVPVGNTTFPAVLGMELDASNRLWIAGGSTGRMWVLDTSSGKVIKALQVPNPTASLINDVAVVGNAAYFTDTRVATLWRVQSTAAGVGEVEPWLDFAGTPLQYYDGANLNGIAATPDGRSLIVVQMGKGLLYKIDIATKAVTAIDTAGADLTTADGLVLDGNTLYVVRQGSVEVATVNLTDNMTKGTVVSRFKDPALAWPATAVKVGNQLIVVNTQFNTRGNKTQTLPFTLVAIPLGRLAPTR